MGRMTEDWDVSTPTRVEVDADERGDYYYDGPDVVETGGVRCAHCKRRHATVADVRWCGDIEAEAKAEAAAEAAWEAAGERAYAEDREAQAERGTWFGTETVEEREAEAEAQAADDERRRASDWSWEYQKRWGRAENE